MTEPKLRNAHVKEPYPLGEFPEGFAKVVAGELSASIAVGRTDVEGKDWEQIFAKAIKAEWHPSVIGLDDILVPSLSAAWGAKTVKNSKPFLAKRIRLISGRNSLAYSYDVSDLKSLSPSEIGEKVLGIWNERVASLYKKYKTLRTVTLLKGPDLKNVSVFEKDTVRYFFEEYDWKWNKGNNLVGIAKSNDETKFTWQPHGAQFTIHENVPDNALHIELDPPKIFPTDAILKLIGFGDKSFRVIEKGGQKD